MMDYSRGEPEPAGPMDGNPHYEKATNGPKPGRDYSAHQAMYDAAIIQANSTLALAYEQRTANLIAAMSTLHLDATGWHDSTIARWTELAIEIGSRLAFNGANE